MVERINTWNDSSIPQQWIPHKRSSDFACLFASVVFLYWKMYAQVFVQVDYPKYYSLCNAQECTFVETRPRTLLEILPVLLGLVGGIATSVRFFVDIFLPKIFCCCWPQEETDEANVKLSQMNALADPLVTDQSSNSKERVYEFASTDEQEMVIEMFDGNENSDRIGEGETVDDGGVVGTNVGDIQVVEDDVGTQTVQLDDDDNSSDVPDEEFEKDTR